MKVSREQRTCVLRARIRAKASPFLCPQPCWGFWKQTEDFKPPPALYHTFSSLPVCGLTSERPSSDQRLSPSMPQPPGGDRAARCHRRSCKQCICSSLLGACFMPGALQSTLLVSSHLILLTHQQAGIPACPSHRWENQAQNQKLSAVQEIVLDLDPACMCVSVKIHQSST